MAAAEPLPSRPSSAAGHAAVEMGLEGPLWSTIKRQLYRSEVSCVKRLVGESLIQQNRLAWEELVSLRQILTDFQRQNEEISEALTKQVQLCGSQHRDLLRRQAQIVLEDVRTQAEAHGHDIEDLLPELRDDKQLYDYLLGKDRRSLSKLGLHGTPPTTPSTRPSTAGARSSSCCSASPEPFGPFGMQPLSFGRALSIEELEDVAKGIREALESEHESLLGLIGELTERLEAEAAGRSSMRRGEPSTAKLQQFAHKLQELAVSPGSLRTLFLTGPISPSRRNSAQGADDEVDAFAPPPLPPVGGSNIRRLQALIKSRRQEAPVATASLGAVPEAPQNFLSMLSPSGGYPGEPALPTPAGAKQPFDIFFDDPFA
eukprot:gnl/TRDRNA2_/TRDRNA2_190731_c0_seq1.p1 gnl/TRDRNA2_/TRDRNA2_190731_c0~~gnl/TRDRNA2_/TRDRNA2_190731_c0_seq1.p1  ORF type:complete len:395 (-),score=78.38 gnl/TRDRNA2_/TRDRNA2_190731_c0_seq1:156-1274(-)